MSDFASLNTALSGLMAHRRATEVIANNIANVNTEGYSRQRAELVQQGSGAVPAVFSTPRPVGDGVRAETVTRIRDLFLEKRMLNEQSTASALSTTSTTLNRIESSFPEPSDIGLAQQLAEFWSGWDDIANSPGTEGVRAQLLERASTLADTFNRTSADLTALRDSSFEQFEALTADVNTAATQIAELNGAVQSAVSAGLPASDLADRRDLLIDSLSKRIGVTIREGDNGTIDVMVGGTALVRGDRAEQLAVNDDVQPPGATLTAVGWNRTGLVWARDGYPVAVSGGEIDGLLQSINDIVPRYLGALNSSAIELATEVNNAQAAGFDRNGTAGVAMFAFTVSPDPLPIDAASRLSVAISDPAEVAAASDATALLDGSNAGRVSNAFFAATPGGHDVDRSYTTMVGALGVETQNAARRSDIQDAITSQVDVERKSVRGVNLDEEMVGLVAAQHAYDASARLMTTIDEMIQTLINLGR